VAASEPLTFRTVGDCIIVVHQVNRWPRHISMWYQKKAKYNNKSSVYDGYYYQSKKEAGHAQFLDLSKKAGDPSKKVIKWERQVPIDFYINGIKITRYVCDFKVWYADGRIVWEEVKGLELPLFIIKRRLMEALYLPEHKGEEHIVIK